MVHQYLWWKGYAYPGAPPDANVSKQAKRFRGYDAAVVGDNHQGFCLSKEPGQKVPYPCSILNAGTFQRRRIDEQHYLPVVGLLHSDGSIQCRALNCSKDRFLAVDKEFAELARGIGLATFVEELAALGDAALDFGEAVRRIMQRDKTPENIRRLILSLLES